MENNQALDKEISDYERPNDVEPTYNYNEYLSDLHKLISDYWWWHGFKYWYPDDGVWDFDWRNKIVDIIYKIPDPYNFSILYESKYEKNLYLELDRVLSSGQLSRIRYQMSFMHKV